MTENNRDRLRTILFDVIDTVEWLPALDALDAAGVWVPPEGAVLEEGQGVVDAPWPSWIPPGAMISFDGGRVLMDGADVTERYHAHVDHLPVTAYRTYSWPVPPRLCPECASGKHGACSDLAADEDGEPSTCQCLDPDDGNPNAK